jgi:hypothetical protein
MSIPATKTPTMSIPENVYCAREHVEYPLTMGEAVDKWMMVGACFCGLWIGCIPVFSGWAITRNLRDEKTGSFFAGSGIGSLIYGIISITITILFNANSMFNIGGLVFGIVSLVFGLAGIIVGRMMLIRSIKPRNQGF